MIYKFAKLCFACARMLFDHWTGQAVALGAGGDWRAKILTDCLLKGLWKSDARGVCELMNSWDQIRNYLHSRLSQESYDNWFSGANYVCANGETLTVSVPDRETRTLLETEYAGVVNGAIRDLKLPVRQVNYNSAPERGTLNQTIAAMDSPEIDTNSCALNPKFTFESFVVGNCNQFAHAAAQSVAVNPSRSYNPLFLYGGSGMGKTHLIQAIGRALMDRFGAMRVIYTSSERFMNEMVTCIRTSRMGLFHQRYRAADVLLVDDIQLLGNKERTQEEFFHTFNELHDHQKQIVISSDAPPKEIPGLLERLRSRFEWGLMADIQPPDLETKMAILDKKAAAVGVKLPDEVRSFMASKTKSNVRELEGALVKLIAYSELTGAPIHLQMAQQVLKHLIHLQDRKVSIDSIQKAVAERFQIRQSQLKEKSNTQKVVYPRQVAMYLVKELTDASLPEIGRAFGGKHHTTVIHSINKIEQARCNDADLNRLLHSLMDSLQ
jgi:chromosomal replication initiator protein